MKTILAAIAGLCTTYLAFVFVMWEFNPGEWNEVARFICVWLGILASVVAGGFASTTEE